MGNDKSSKQVVGVAAAEYVRDGMRLGLGTGSTVAFFLEALAERINSEKIEVVGVCTSRQTEEHAKKLGIKISTLAETPRLDLVVDGADEVDNQFRLIKGGGGALLREKIVAAASERVIIIISEGKYVDKLASSFLLPVEVLPFGYSSTKKQIAQKGGCTPYLRTVESGEPFITDNGNYIFDCKFESGIDDPEAIHSILSQIAGVAEVGIFLNLCDLVLEADAEGNLVKHTKDYARNLFA
ncbi:MAG: ribose-5-phosphate isomerase RpiA [Planctomycetes bacterium]|nr:ribose-5-phosphate isomerase RpiA [Planctomycetota bacterium]